MLIVPIAEKSHDVMQSFLRAVLREAAENAGKARQSMGRLGHSAVGIKETKKQEKI